jgi:hypothetical protein
MTSNLPVRRCPEKDVRGRVRAAAAALAGPATKPARRPAPHSAPGDQVLIGPLCGTYFWAVVEPSNRVWGEV